MEIKATLNKPYTDRQKCDFIVLYNHQHGYDIKDTEVALEAWGMTAEEEAEKIIEDKKERVRAVRNQYLADTDKYMIVDFPITEEEKDEYKEYRQYLRDYTKEDYWFEHNPMTFEEWKGKEAN